MRSGTPLSYVYLDQFAWIELAKAYLGKNNKAKPTLDLAFAAARDSRVVFPLSIAHMMETTKIRSRQQRAALVPLMTALSQGWFIAPQERLVRPQLTIRLAEEFGREAELPQVPEPFGRSFVHATGHRELILNMKGTELPDELFLASLDTPQALSYFLMNPTLSKRIIDRFEQIAREKETRRKIVKQDSKAVRKRAYLAGRTLSLGDALFESFSIIGISKSDFLALGARRLTCIFESIPPLHVEVELHTERDEHWDRKIAANDELDIGFLSVAVPYCDAVVTEPFWISLLKRKKLDEKYDTILLSKVQELNDFL